MAWCHADDSGVEGAVRLLSGFFRVSSGRGQLGPRKPPPISLRQRDNGEIGANFNGLLDPSMAEKIPELPRIVAFRNILIHGYASVDDRLVWGVVEDRLEPLLDVIAALLSED